MAAKAKINTAELAKMRKALGYGMLNFGYAVQADAQRSFTPFPPASTPGNPPAAPTGNLRRSIQAVAYVDGAELLASGPHPAYPGEVPDIGVIVGTNTGYGLYLELGTVHMAARPFLTPAFNRQLASAERLIAAGAKAHYRP